MERTAFEQAVAETLRLHREQKGLTQAELAKLCSFDPSHISHFEAGRRTPDRFSFFKLAGALNVPARKIASMCN